MRDNALLVALAVAALLQLALATGMHAGQGGRLAGARKLLVSEESCVPPLPAPHSTLPAPARLRPLRRTAAMAGR